MGMYLLGGNGQFYKANLHCHTNLSDGYLTPEEVKSLYKSHGYSIVAFTDHDILIPHKDLQDDSFLPLNGMEFTLVSPEEEAGLPGKHPTIHLCMIGLEEDNITMPLLNIQLHRAIIIVIVKRILFCCQDSRSPFIEIQRIASNLDTNRHSPSSITPDHSGQWCCQR